MNRALREHRFIAAVIKDGDGRNLQQCRSLPVSIFEDHVCARAWRSILKADGYEVAVTHPDARPFFANPTFGENFEEDRDFFFIEHLRQVGLKGAREWLDSLPNLSGDCSALRARLSARGFNFATPPAEPVPRFQINGRGVCTPGNLTNIIAQAKAGKTALISAMIAAAICAEFGRDGQDTLGVTATKLAGKKILHLDTEQSPFDHDALIRRSMRRAGIETETPWLLSYGLAGFCAKDLRQSLRLLMQEAHASGGIFAVIIDGTADLVNDVNDPEESNGFVAELHGLAIQYDCPIIGVVHENPGQDGGKMRGHLGSQLERKAESNLRLKKTEEVTVVFSEKMRKAPIRESEGPRFKWSDDAGMHVSLASNITLREAEEIQDLRELAEEVFSGNRLRYADACQKIESARRVGTKAGEKWFTRMKKHGVIQSVGMGMWEAKAA